MNCNQCNHHDTCANSCGAGMKLLPPLTKRGEKPECHECNHAHWAMSVSNGTRQCLSVCGVIKPLNDESVQITYTR